MFGTDDHLQLKPPCRYSSCLFPPYRYLPGVNAHPVRDPLGHAFGRVEAKLNFIAPEFWQENPDYLYGVDLYNHGYWWEAHEAWEGVWHTTDKDGAYGQCLQGLIQIAAAFIKWQLKQQEGLSRLYAIGRGRLETVAAGHSSYLGLNLTQFLQRLEIHFAPVLIAKTVWPDPLANYPYLVF